MQIRSVLRDPRIYQMFQEGFGFFNARVFAVEKFLEIKPGSRVLDIGCGPGYIVKHLPKDVSYAGYDIDPSYIEFAQRTFGDRGTFHCRLFDAAAAKEFGKADIALMNGVLHHLPDDLLLETVGTIKSALNPGGVLFTLDGCYRDGQNRLAKWLLDKDRGEFVRTQSEYEALLKQRFGRVEMQIQEGLSRLPYTFVFGRSYV